MFKKVLIAYVVVLIPIFALGQASGEKSAFKNMAKHRWAKAYDQLRRALIKDSADVSARYTLAAYFFTPQNPDFQIDSAYNHTVMALAHWSQHAQKERDKLKRSGLDSSVLVVFRERIDSAAFEKAKGVNTVAAYENFLMRHAQAKERAAAERLRNDVAFTQTRAENSYAAFEEYIRRYPSSIHVPEAKRRYERLLYEDKTRDHQLKSYEKFLEDFPDSPHRVEAEEHIFHHSTMSGTAHDFIRFVRRHPQNHKVKQAVDLVYHILLEEHQESLFPPEYRNDSLSAISRLNQSYLIPFLKQGKFGFMTDDGTEVIAAHEAGIRDEYRCGNIVEDVVMLSDKIIARNGSAIWQGSAEGLEDLGYGFLRLEVKGGVIILHKSGFRVTARPVEDAKLLNGRVFALKEHGTWGLVSLTGKPITDFDWDDITASGNGVLVFRRYGKYGLATLDTVTRAYQQASKPVGDFDEVKRVSDGLFWVRAGDTEGVLTATLATHIAPAPQRLTPAFFGFKASLPAGYAVYNKAGERSDVADKIAVQEPWVAMKKINQWTLFEPATRKFISEPYDSLWLYGAFAIGITKDSLKVHMNEQRLMHFPKTVKFEFVPGRDSTSYLLVTQDDKRSIYDNTGKKLFTVTYDQVQYAGRGFFIVTKKEKKGLVNEQGKVVLPVEYDAIGSEVNGVMSLLKSRKFGLYDCVAKKLFKPEYDKNMVRYARGVYTSSKSGGIGFVDDNNKPLSQFAFSEVIYWTDSLALVKKNDRWMVQDFYTGRTVIGNIDALRFIRDSDEEKLVIIRQDKHYGVMSNQKGLVIPPSFTDLVNVGSAEVPTYFTEKHVAEASLFIVIYYDHTGEMLRKEVYESDDYDAIYCSE